MTTRRHFLAALVAFPLLGSRVAHAHHRPGHGKAPTSAPPAAPVLTVTWG